MFVINAPPHDWVRPYCLHITRELHTLARAAGCTNICKTQRRKNCHFPGFSRVTVGCLFSYLTTHIFSTAIPSEINAAQTLAWLCVLPGRRHFYTYSDASLSTHLHFEYPVTTEAPSLKRSTSRRYNGASRCYNSASCCYNGTSRCYNGASRCYNGTSRCYNGSTSRCYNGS